MFERQSQQMRWRTILADVVLTAGMLLGAYWLRELFVGSPSSQLP